MNSAELNTRIRTNQNRLRETVKKLQSRRTEMRGTGAAFATDEIIMLANECERLVEELRKDVVAAGMYRDGLKPYETRELR